MIRKLKVVMMGCLVGYGITTTLIACGEKDELMDEPSWLGNSIYERLGDEGGYKYTLRLIDDLGQKAVLSQTGSKTLFVANDSVYDEFFRQNSWGVSRYDDLSLAQKKLLLQNMTKQQHLVILLQLSSRMNTLRHLQRILRL